MIIRTAILLVFGLASLGHVASVSADEPPLLNASGAYHVDGRGFTTANIMLSSSRLPLGIGFWGFTDFHGDHGSDSTRLTRSFSEYRLTHAGVGKLAGISGLAAQVEYNAITGSGNDVTRVGLAYRHDVALPWRSAGDLSGWMQWRAFPYESDNDGGQVSLIWFLPLTERLAFKGFADYNVHDAIDNRWVLEPELSFKVSSNLSALIELRHNEYEVASPVVTGTSVAVGFRYQFTR